MLRFVRFATLAYSLRIVAGFYNKKKRLLSVVGITKRNTKGIFLGVYR